MDRFRDLRLSVAFAPPLSVIGSSGRSTLGLLKLRRTFVESALVAPDDFVREAHRRGIDLERDELEELHRRRALVPFYEILRSPIAEPMVGLETGSVVYGASLVQEVYRAAASGRLRDPRLAPFRAWPRGESSLSRYAYSLYQLIALREVKALQGLMVRRKAGDRKKLVLPVLPELAAQAADDLRALVWVLSALDGRYRPLVTGTVHSPVDEWYVLSEGEPNAIEREALADVDPPTLERQADVLLARAKHIDPTGDLARLIRHGSARTWDRLRLDALRAMDYRIAAEILLRHREYLAERGEAPPLEAPSGPFWTPRLERLGAPQAELEERLMEFDLSPGPSVVLLVEGETEALLMPRILNLLAPSSGTLIEIHATASAYRDVVAFAQSVGMVRVLGPVQEYLRLRRPPVGLFVLMDAEGKFASNASRAKQRERIISMLLAGLAREYRTPAVRTQFQQLVKLRTWGRAGSFEFAHFSDHELASGVLAVAGLAPGTTPFDVYKAIESHRRRDPAPALDRAVARIAPPFSKLVLAEYLWRRLKSRCQRALVSSAVWQPPALREAKAIMELAYQVRPVRVLKLT